jgi:hypothetical protein
MESRTHRKPDGAHERLTARPRWHVWYQRPHSLSQRMPLMRPRHSEAPRLAMKAADRAASVPCVPLVGAPPPPPPAPYGE